MANINAFLPPGATSDFSAPMTDNTNVGQRLANPNTITKHIAEVNQNLDLMKKLEEEFKMIDVDQNGMITVDELIDFFRNEKVIILFNSHFCFICDRVSTRKRSWRNAWMRYSAKSMSMVTGES